jgi:putative tryptophan/tyrosine transport system substrate-binding protein
VKRREFITFVGGATAAWPLVARAQQPAMPVIGFLGQGSPETDADLVGALRKGLKEAGLVEGQNVAIEFRWPNGQYEQLPALATDLVHRHVNVIAATSTPAALAAKAATGTIPIVFVLGVDPVEIGLVASLNRPGGNVTGVTNLNVELGPKRLELLHELVPAATIIGLLVNQTNPAIAEPLTRDMQAAARTLGLQIYVLHASSERDFDAVFSTLSELRAGGLVIGPDALFISRSKQLAELTVRHAVPTITQFREFVVAGGLMSYGGNITDSWRLAGINIARILKGEKSVDLPVQQGKVELIINMKTAKAFGLTFPITLLGRADEVIE